MTIVQVDGGSLKVAGTSREIAPLAKKNGRPSTASQGLETIHEMGVGSAATRPRQKKAVLVPAPIETIAPKYELLRSRFLEGHRSGTWKKIIDPRIAAIAEQERHARRYEGRVMRNRVALALLLIAAPFIITFLLGQWGASNKDKVYRMAQGGIPLTAHTPNPLSGFASERVPGTPDTADTAFPTPNLSALFGGQPFVPPTVAHKMILPSDLLPVPQGSIIQTFVSVRATAVSTVSPPPQSLTPAAPPGLGP